MGVVVVLIEIVGEGVRNKMIGDGVALESCVGAGARGGVVIGEHALGGGASVQMLYCLPFSD